MLANWRKAPWRAAGRASRMTDLPNALHARTYLEAQVDSARMTSPNGSQTSPLKWANCSACTG